MRHSQDGNFKSGSQFKAALLGSVVLGLASGFVFVGTIHARTAQTITLDIRSQDLGSALTAFADRAGLRLLFPSGVVKGRTSPAISGAMTREQVLSRLLAGTGLSWRFTSPNTVTITGGAAPAGGMADASIGADGSLLLDTINVTGGHGSAPGDVPYYTPAPTAYISSETIERFRGGSPADMFRGTPGVLSAEARNGAGAVDVNIRGMQGLGRVATTIDGTENTITLYQGYQGISNRTFVDPDFLAGVDITKGADAASSGIAGTVAMRTVNAEDIVKKGQTFGMKIRTGMGGNTSSPTPGAKAGYAISNLLEQVSTATSTASGMNRPSFLKPTQGSVSILGAMKEENFDLLFGYAYRKRGNYHAGTNGRVADIQNRGDKQLCYASGICTDFYYYGYLANGGLANYRAGEEVLNTELETTSYLAKGTFRFGDGHAIQFGYNGYRGEAGDQLGSRLNTTASQSVQQSNTVGTKLDTGTMKYHWKPENNDLIDLKSNFWLSKLEARNPLRSTSFIAKSAPPGFRSGSDTEMWGGDISNISKFFSDYGNVDVTLGASYKSEDTKPSIGSKYYDAGYSSRNGNEQQAATYAKAAYKPFDWLTVNGGLRYQYFWSQDRSDPPLGTSGESYGQKLHSGGLSPSFGVTVEPLSGMQLYANYSNAQRLPSLFETTTGFSTYFNDALKPERASNWEIGTNIVKGDIAASGDKFMAKLGYFNWNIDNYISREWKTDLVSTTGGNISSLFVYNIDKAKYSGIEFSSQYEYQGFKATLAANYYINVEFCKTASTCQNSTLYSDYATNQIPPEYSIDLTLSQSFFEDRLTLGSRISHVGGRPIGHGEVTASGLFNFINLVDWDPYTLVDVFAEYKITNDVTASFTVENLTDEYYVDPLSIVQQPGPGRTFYANLTARF